MLKRPKILIACDYPGWAFDNDAKAILSFLSHRYNFTLVYTRDLPIINHREFDVVYCMWWRTDFLERNEVPKEKLCIQVASFWSWQRNFPIPLQELVDKYLNRGVAVTVKCKGLWDLISPLHPHVFLNRDGVDINKFTPGPQKSPTGPLVVGWTGSATTHGDNKGYFTIIKPACASLTGVILKAQVKEEGGCSHDEMPAFYRDIDVYVCASESEGTPNPVLEAASSAKAIISTNVGIVPDLIKHQSNGFIIDRSIDCLTQGLIKLKDNRIKCLEMGRLNREIILSEGWSWEIKANGYAEMFDFILG